MNMNLPTAPLAHVFADTASSYKLFWFRGLLECLKSRWTSAQVFAPGPIRIIAHDIVKEMIVAAWAPVCLFRLSLGKRDRLNLACSNFQNRANLRSNATTSEVRAALSDSVYAALKFAWLLDFVPALYLSPWFLPELRGHKGGRERAKHAEMVAVKLADTASPPPYFLVREPEGVTIVVNSDWASYFRENLGLLEGFIDHHLTIYLQARNPHSPGIVRKLSVPLRRSLAEAKQFWATAMRRSIDAGDRLLGREIYSDRMLNGNVTIDHYLPWSFVAHDQLWNLIPVLKDTNSGKGDTLPDDMYLPLLAKLHWCAIHLLHDKPGWIADHTTFLQKDLGDIVRLTEREFVEQFTNRIKPQIQLAKNQGFSAGWRWRGSADHPSNLSSRSLEKNLVYPS